MARSHSPFALLTASLIVTLVTISSAAHGATPRVLPTSRMPAPPPTRPATPTVAPAPVAPPPTVAPAAPTVAPAAPTVAPTPAATPTGRVLPGRVTPVSRVVPPPPPAPTVAPAPVVEDDDTDEPAAPSTPPVASVPPPAAPAPTVPPPPSGQPPVSTPPPPTGAPLPVDSSWAARAANQLRALRTSGGYTDIKLDPRYGSVALISGGSTPTSGATIEDRARGFLAAQGAVFGIPADLSGIQLITKTRTGTGWHLTFAQTYQGIPVDGSNLVVHLSETGGVFRATSGFVPNLQPKMSPVITREQAMASVNNFLGRSGKPTDRPRIKWAIHAAPNYHVRAWVVNFNPGDRPGFWRIVVDATNGAILKAENRVHSLNGTGTVFNINPIRTLDDDPRIPFSNTSLPRNFTTFRDSNDSNIFVGTDARVYRTGGLLDVFETVPGSGVGLGLEGPTIAISPSSIVFTNGSTQNFNRFDDQFEEVNAYHWIDSLNRYVKDPQKVGVPLQVLNQDRTLDDPADGISQIAANVHDVATLALDPMGQCDGVSRCNQNIAFYDFNFPSLHFYNGGATDLSGTVQTIEGVDLAEDADVVLHEYGHALQDGMIPGGCCSVAANPESAAMGEGFGDYQAAMFAQALGRGGRDPAGFAAWANSPPSAAIPSTTPSQGYGDPAGGPKRRLDGTRNLVFDFVDFDIFQRGQIWAAALWDIKNRVGFRVANRAIYESLYLRAGEGDDMAAGANAILLAHDIMDFGLNRDAIRAVFVQRGILPPLGPDGAAPQLTAARTVNPQLIQLTFDEPLNQSTVNMERTYNSVDTTSACFQQVGNFSVINTTTNVTHSIRAVGQIAPNVIGITLNTTLTTDERPRIRVLELTDPSGNRAFCTDTNNLVGGLVDGIPPRLVSVTKPALDTVQVVFSEPMNAGTIGLTTFKFSGFNRNATAVTTVSPTTFNIQFSPTTRALERLIVRLGGVVSDANGVVLQPGAVAPVVTP